MTETQDVAVRRQGSSAERQAAPRLTPAVDLYEDHDGITLTADMPGVAPEDLEVEVKDGELVIEGAVRVDMPEGMKARYAELKGGRYRRSFTLSQDIDTDQIRARLKLGVLTVDLPRKAAFKPRRIPIR